MPLVSITRLRVRSWRFLPMFFFYALRSTRQASRSDGNLATRLLRDRRNTFWTATLWTSDVEMKRFMLAGVHGRAMRKLLHWCDEAALVHGLRNTPPPLVARSPRPLANRRKTLQSEPPVFRPRRPQISRPARCTRQRSKFQISSAGFNQ